MKRFLPLLIILLLLTACTASAADDETALYGDLPAGQWYSESALYCLADGVIDETADGTFSPHEPFTRGETALAFWRTAESPAVSGESSFADLPESADEIQAIRWATNASVMSGYTSNRFGAGDPLTREQMAVILFRYEQHKNEISTSNGTVAFSDQAFISDWATAAVSWAVREEIISGRPDNLFAPQDMVTRAEVAVILHHYLLWASDIVSDTTEQIHDRETGQSETDDEMTDVEITVGNQVFPAKFYGNEAAQAILAQMPLTLTMSDLNRNEKYYHLPENLPVSSSERPATIQAGEIMCWSGNSLVLFYDTFANSYGGYVRLGFIEDTEGLPAALGAGDVEVTFAIKNGQNPAVSAATK